jgi:diguanylate cyclase (GGDEF)-like protein
MTVPFTDGGGTPRVPVRALVLSTLALAVPILGMVVFPGLVAEDAGILLWLTTLVPPFLLTYYRGWQGSSLGLAGGMAALAVAHLLTEVMDLGAPNYTFLLWITATFIIVCVGIGVLAEILRSERRKAQEMALTDALTGLPNRRHAGVFLDAAFSAAVRGQNVSAVLLDVDDFKPVNDNYGHKVGDDVLRALGRVLTVATRRMDLTARWGGEEFLSILSDCDADGATVFVDRVQELLAQEEFPCGPITVSAGIAQYREGMGSPELLVAAADQALYQAKDAGKNRWRIAGKKKAEVEEVREKEIREQEVQETATAPRGVRGEGPQEPAPDGKPRPASVDQPPQPFRDEPPAEEPVRNLKELPGGWERILLVDDDEAAREAIGKILRRLGYVVVEAEDGETALEKVRNLKELDLLLTDLIMPGMSGFSLGAQVEKTLGPRRILYMSGYVQREVAFQDAPGATVAFLEKPMLPQDLARKVRDLLDEPLAEAPVGAGVE